MNDNKKSILIICGLIFLLILTTILYNKTNDNKISKDEVTNVNEIKSNLSKKIKLMSADDLLSDLYNDDLTLDNFNNMFLSGILLSIEEDGELTEEESDKLYNRTGICINTSYINLSTIESNIDELYGNNIKLDYNKLLKNTDFYYDNVTKKFYSKCVSSLDKTNYIESYIYDYKINDRDAYVYVSVAFLEEKYNDDDVTIYVYKDVNKDKLFATYKDDEYFILDETNYSKFTLYKYHFKNNNGNYYFNSLKKIN